MKDLLCVQRGLVSFFKVLASFIAKYPRWVIFVSIFSSFLMGFGILRIKFETDFDYLFAPFNCRAYQEKEILEKLFPINKSENFDFLRMIDRGRFGSVIIIPKDKGSVLRVKIFSETLALDKIIKSIHVKFENDFYNFSNLCAKNYGKCQDNNILQYAKDIHKIETRRSFIKYPAVIDFGTISFNISGVNLGGVTVDRNDDVLEAKALRLFYFLDDSDEIMNNLATLWEEKFLKTMEEQKFDHIIISRFISQTLNQESWIFALEALKISWMAAMIIVGFCVFTAMTSDWVTSKPLLGLSACISVLLSIIASLGFVALCGLPGTAVNIAIPFLIAGIGVDDSFVLIAAWRRTNPSDNVTKRMIETYSEAAMSVTITSLTNFLSFSVGMMIPFPVVRIFCIYAVAAILFTYIYQITFFGGCMVLDGYREEKHLHPLTLQPLIPLENATHRGRLYRLLFTHNSSVQSSVPKPMIWCRDTLGEWISKKSTRVIIVLAFLVYLTGAGYGVTILKQGTEYKDIFPKSSYASTFAINFNHYFTQYPHPIHVVINTTLDYSDPKVQTKIMNMMDRFFQNQYIEGEKWQVLWLSHYLYFIKQPRFWIYKNRYNFSNSEDFIHCLKNVFLRHKTGRFFKNDIKFSEDGKEIIATRFVIISKNIKKSMMEKALIMNVRQIADSSEIPITVQNFWWINYEQLLIIETITIQTVITAIIVIMVVFFIFIPYLPNAVCITLNIGSIQLGVIGYMALWQETLDTSATIILTICIGFSIDYAAHVSYAYLVAPTKSTKEKIKYSLFAAGMPIIQGGLSTILSILVMLFIPSYIFIKLFKIVFLLVLFSLFHGFFILPTFLSFWDIIHNKTCKSSKRNKMLKYSNPSEVVPMATNGTTNN